MAETDYNDLEALLSATQPDEAAKQATPEAEATPDDEALSSREQLMRSLASDDEEGGEFTIESIRHLFDILPRWMLGQWRMVLIILVGIIIYITNGYQAQMEMMEETALEAELKDWGYRSVTRAGELAKLCRQSLLEDMLRQQGDSTLQPSHTAPYIINADD